VPGKPPERIVPLLYLGAAHVALVLACILTGLWPQAVAGFLYHAWLILIVHLVTLGWITFSILGAIYIVGPLALRMDMPARKADYVAYACAVIGLIGMVGHFWIQEYGGMAWSAATIAGGVFFMTVRIATAIKRAALQPPVKLHLILACVNFWFAASMGILIAYDKVAHFLPGFVLSNVFAHAHLAALGWATMMVVGVGYRMLPMTFPSKMPSGRSAYVSAILLETGVLGLFITLLLGSPRMLGFGLAIVAGLAVFAAHVMWMLRHSVPGPIGARRPDFAVLQCRQRRCITHRCGSDRPDAARCANVAAHASRGGIVRRLRVGWIPGADGRRYGDTATPDGGLVLAVRAKRLPGAATIAARDARSAPAGRGLRGMVHRRARACGRTILGIGATGWTRCVGSVRRCRPWNSRQHFRCDRYFGSAVGRRSALHRSAWQGSHAASVMCRPDTILLP
jgi:hypothetical protein